MVVLLAGLNKAWHKRNKAMPMDMGGGKFKKASAWAVVAILVIGMAVHLGLTMI